MLPAVQLGGISIHLFGVIYVIGLVSGATLSFHRLQQLRRPPRHVMQAAALIFVGGALGASGGVRAIVALQGVLQPGQAVKWDGISVLGALAGGMLVALACCLVYRAPVGRAFDLGVLPVPLAQAIGRLGCFAAGCCYGRPTDSWLGMVLPGENGSWQARYPTQLMSAGADLFIFASLLAVERCAGQRRPFDGFLFLLYGALYCLKRLGMEFLRGDALPPLAGPLNLVQLLCLAVLVGIGGRLAWRASRQTA